MKVRERSISDLTENVECSLTSLLGHVEPFDIDYPAPLSAGFSSPGPQAAYPDSPSSPSFDQMVTRPNPSRESQSGTSETALTYVSESPTQPRVGKAALIALRDQDVQQPAQFRDSGIKFNDNGEQDVGPSQSPNEVPPTYTPG